MTTPPPQEQELKLPTWQGVFEASLADLDAARSALSNAASWLRSDWRPLGRPLPDEAGTARRDVLGQIGHLKDAIDEAKGALWSALNGHESGSSGQFDDEFAADIVARCSWAQRHNDGHPSLAWSTGEQLAVALVLRDRIHLDGMGYTVKEAADRVHGGMASPPPDLGVWLDGIRAALRIEGT